MKKKLLTLIFTLCLIIPCVIVLGACTKEKEPTNSPAPEPVNEVKVLLSDDGKTLYRFAPDNDVTEYIVPEGVEIIDTSAFENCCNLTKVVLPSSLTTIEEKAFYDCSQLTTVEINSDICVNKESFYDCISLSTIDFSKIIEYGECAFEYCGGLTSITIAKEVTSLPERVFGFWSLGNSNLSSVTFEENSRLKQIYDEAFSWQKNLSSINIPDSCLYIGAKAFERTGLINLTIGKNVTEIGSQAFTYCSNLLSVEFTPYSNRFNDYIQSNNIFAHCQNLITVTNYPRASIKDGYFDSCYKLSSFTFANDFGSSVAGPIGSRAFADCRLLKEFTIPSHITQIKDYAFLNCYSLNKVIIEHSGLLEENIDETAFDFCYSLFEIYNLDTDLQLTLGEGIAKYAKDIYTSLDTPSKIKSVNNVVYYDNGTDFIALAPIDRNVATIEFDGKTTEINSHAFYYNCAKIKNIVLQEGIIKIGESAFWGCMISRIDIPESVIEIGDLAFDSDYLWSVTLNNNQISNTCESYYSNGSILAQSNFVYIKSGLTVTNSTYLLNNFTKQETSDKTGYDMYVRN